MNAELLSKIIVDSFSRGSESVALPSLGTFIARSEPARFSSNGYCLLPPSRSLMFKERFMSSTDVAVALAYSEIAGISLRSALEELEDFCATLRETLHKDRSVHLPALGKLRLTREGEVFFVPDEDLVIDADSFALEPLSLKVSEVEVKAQPQLEPEQVQEQEPVEPVSEVVSEPVTEVEPEVESEPETRKPMSKTAKTLLAAGIVIASVAALLGIFVLLAHSAPDFIDSLLYSEEELQILATQL